MNISDKAKCAVFSDADLEASSLTMTLKQIEHNPEKFYLLASDAECELHEAIERLSEHVRDDDTEDYNVELTRIRFARDIEFGLPVFLRIGEGVMVRSLAELLENLSYDDAMKLNRRDYQVVVDDDGITETLTHDDKASLEVVRLFQQLVHLNLNLDIRKKSELRTSIIKMRFRAKHKELYREAQARKAALESAISSHVLGEDGTARLQRIADSLGEMLNAFDEGRKRTLKIAAMGTKKAGKSVIINSILKRDYAPTSSELPTPNIVRYVPCSEDTPLTLEYQGMTQTFETPEALSKYILDEFKAAQKNTGEGSGLEDMTIYYPSDEYTGYEVIDTPGPNFAGAGEEHYRIARDCIREADICIFVMNYSNHLTTDEQKFLEEIRSSFTDQGKFYSLFIAVNRIDERYASEVEKSVSRLVDYIRSRLEGLGYMNIVLFGTSALQSFYLDKTFSLMRELNISPSDDEPLAPFLESMFDDYPKQTRKHTNELAFIETALRNLKHFHGVRKPTASDIGNFSGIPQLEHHLQYIGEAKVDNEIVSHVIGKCDGYFSEISNALLLTKLLELSEADRAAIVELDRRMRDFTYEAQRKIDDVNLTADDRIKKSMLLELTRESASNRDEILGIVEESCSLAVKKAEISEDDLITAGDKDAPIPPAIRKLNTSMLEIAAELSARYADAIRKTSESVNIEHTKQVEQLLSDHRGKVNALFEDVKSQVDAPAALSLIDEFSIPDFPPSLSKLDMTPGSFGGAVIEDAFLKAAAEDSHSRVTEKKTKTESRRVKREARGFWENVCSFFGKEYYEYRDFPIPYDDTRDVYDVGRFKRIVAAALEKKVRNSVEAVMRRVNDAAERDAERIFSVIADQCEKIRGQYMANFESLSNDIQMTIDTKNQHRQSLLNDIAALNGIAEDFRPLFAMWDEVKNGRKEER